MESDENSLMQFPSKQESCLLISDDEDETFAKSPKRAKRNKSNISSVTTSARKRMSLTIEKKLEIIKRHEKGETQKKLAESYQVGR